MASVFGHAAAAYGLLHVHSRSIFNRTVLFLGICSSIIPDIDVLAYNYGIMGDHILGHRGLTHSILFGLVWAMILVILFHKNESNRLVLFTYYSIVTISHGLLDSMTTGGEGIAFFYPLTDERYYFPLRFITVSPIGALNFFSEWGLKVLINEAKYIGSFTILLIIIGKWIKSRK